MPESTKSDGPSSKSRNAAVLSAAFLEFIRGRKSCIFLAPSEDQKLELLQFYQFDLILALEKFQSFWSTGKLENG